MDNLSHQLYKKGDFIGQKYEVYDMLGKDGFGIVYLVYHHKNSDVYALKTFGDEYLEDTRVRERFKNEALVWDGRDAVHFFHLKITPTPLYTCPEVILFGERGARGDCFHSDLRLSETCMFRLSRL